jgi:hypothetical protein
MIVKVYNITKENISDVEATCKLKKGSPPLNWKDFKELRRRLHLLPECTYVVCHNHRAAVIPALPPAMIIRVCNGEIHER